MGNLSGSGWWKANQRRYPNSQDLNDLEPGFRDNVEAFVRSLKDAAAVVVVSSTRRNKGRAYLMHYSWMVAYGEIQPQDVPSYPGIMIDWDHGDATASQKAAREMVNLFGMAHNAALDSNHIRGKAVDMTIRWTSDLVLTRPAPLLVKVTSGPKTGQNRELQDVAASVFGVRKLRSDPPHWSVDGR